MFKKKILKLDDIKQENIFFKNIEFNRLKLIRKLSFKNNIIFSIVCICSTVLLISLFFVNNSFILFGLTTFNLLFLFFYYYFFYFRQKNRMSNIYLKNFFDNLNSFVFQNFMNDKNIDFKLSNSYEEDKKLFFDSNIFNDVFYFQNQNSLNLRVNDTNINLFDCVAQKKTFKKLEYLFVGKFLFIPNNYLYDNEIIIFLSKNTDNSDRLNFFCSSHINNFAKIFSDQNVSIFAKNIENIPNDFINNIIKNLVINDILISVIISIKKNKTYFCLNYVTKNLLNPPFNQEFNGASIIKFKNDLQNIINILVH